MFNKNKKTLDEFSDILDDDIQEPKQQIDLIKEILENTQSNIQKALELIKEKDIDTDALIETLKLTKEASVGLSSAGAGGNSESSLGARVIEGVFNGEKMVAGDGAEFIIPANYSSKSKLVEGDILKLTIKNDGSFIYKQIGPVERKQQVATLVQSDGNWYAVFDNKRWKLLTASVTYFHGASGDDVVILIPKDGATKWAAVENIIKTNKY